MIFTLQKRREREREEAPARFEVGERGGGGGWCTGGVVGWGRAGGLVTLSQRLKLCCLCNQTTKRQFKDQKRQQELFIQS